MSMDMRISGSGKIPAGEYGHVSVSGSGRLSGLVRCDTFSSSGSSKGDSMACRESFRVSGSSSFSESVSAGSVGVSGAFSCGGDMTAVETISCSGSVRCKGNVKSDQLSVSGVLTADGDAEAEEIRVHGCINCGGLLNAETLEIRFKQGMSIGSIGGSRIQIIREQNRVFRLFWRWHESLDRITVASAVEGDEITLEYVTCPRVTGRAVTIGAGCKIDLVQYSETVEISPDAKVGRTEKV